MPNSRSIRALPWSSVRYWLLGLAWLAMACRAAVPVGYMPDAQSGLQWLALCSGGGQSSRIAVVLFEHDTEAGQGTQAMHCVFCAQPGLDALPSVMGAGMAWMPAASTWAPVPNWQVGRHETHGPPLGARAPPSQRLT